MASSGICLQAELVQLLSIPGQLGKEIERLSYKMK